MHGCRDTLPPTGLRREAPNGRAGRRLEELPGPGCGPNPRLPVLRRPASAHRRWWQWNRYDSGKTITHLLTEHDARLYQEWIANRRRLAGIIAKMQKAGQAAEVLLLRVQLNPDGDPRRSANAPKLTRQLTSPMSSSGGSS